jgi:c-di-GMP-binding flagellar brake protein YcgR
MGQPATAIDSTRLMQPVMLYDGKDRRRKRRIQLSPMYTSAVLRVLSSKMAPLEGHIVDISESGLSIEVDEKIKPGSAVTIEFTISGLGRMRNSRWPMFAAAAEVVRLDNVDDFPQGPYRTAVRFIRLPSIVQAQIARYIIAHPPASSRV